MKALITLRQILNARWPKGHRLQSKASKIAEARQNNSKKV